MLVLLVLLWILWNPSYNNEYTIYLIYSGGPRRRMGGFRGGGGKNTN